MMNELSPCLYCYKVPDPKNCDNKKCKPWQNWFVKRWEQTRKQFRTPMERAALLEGGVPLGGHRYASPHRVREYLENGPCPTCKLPRELCDSPCPAHRVWQTRKEKEHELESTGN